jgi:two-component system nitrogen regulation response regulator NtrX
MAWEVLIVDDEADIRSLTAGVLADEGYRTREAKDSAAALASVEVRRPSLVLLDIWLQGSELDGLGILKELKKRHASVPVLMMSGHGTIETAVTAIKEGAYDFIEKPFTTDRLLLMVERAIEAARLRREVEELRTRAGPTAELIGRSPAIREIQQAIERVAPTNSRVLITGPAGAGKEVVARFLHARSRRAQGPFVVLNCATLHPDHVERELFGAEAGGDQARKIGTLERSHGGTLLLDEVTDMPIETQGKIVRVLQEQVFERVGGTTRVEVDVRVIASATRDIGEAIAGGRFREDLFYRLNVVPIRVPPLKERREDIPVLAASLIERAAEISGRPRRRLGDDAFVALQSYDWPGNVRELRNVIERLLIMAPGRPDDPVRAHMLPPEIGGGTLPAADAERGAELLAMSLRDARESFERRYLLAQLSRFDRNVSRTAEFVGMERAALHRKLKSLGIAGGDGQKGMPTRPDGEAGPAGARPEARE